jgi:alcohol dehydrogenase
MGHDSDIKLPHVPGHELAGVISSVGSGVTKFAVGDRVTVPFVCGCGKCEFCLRGDAQVCPTQTQPGFTGFGSFAEYVALSNADFNLVRIPNGVSFATAAALGCRFATAYRGLVKRALVKSGEIVVVYGCGGVGLSAVMIAKALGASVYAVDVNEGALEMAASLGANVLNASKVDPVSVMQ